MEKLTVFEQHIGMRLDAFLAQVEAYPSRSIAAKFCEFEKVLVNNSPKPKNFKLSEGDEIE